MYRIRYIEKNFKFYKVNYDGDYHDTDVSVSLELPNNKYFDNDIIDDKFNVIDSIVRNKYHIGYFSTSSTITYGKTKNGKKLYQLNTLNYNLPNFKISYNGKLKGKILVIFKYLNWNDKVPQGCIIDIIGLFNEENINKAYIYYYYLSAKKNKIIPCRNILEDNITRKDLCNHFIISIDPEGSVDIDDAISMDDNYIYIHIAQPISYMSLDDILESSKTRFSTLYLPSGDISLFGDSITMNSSLLENHNRNAYTIVFNNIGEMIDNFPSIINVNKNLSYDYVNNNREQFENLFKFSEKIFEKLDSAQKLVEKWMIHTNCCVGNILQKTIYRTNMTDINIIKNINQDDMVFMYEASDYIFSNNEDNNIHNILGKKNYVHFTSPIRRMVDNFIHYQLTYKKQMVDDEYIKLFMKNINYLSKQTNKMHRMISLRKSINNIEDNMKVNAKVIYKDNIKLKLLIPELGLFNYYYKNETLSDNIEVNNIISININKVNNIYPNRMLVLSLNEKNDFYL